MNNKKNQERAESSSGKNARPAFTAELPGRELPGERGQEHPLQDSLNGTELFSYFTADIIKEDVVFTR